jgi:hypothetical protein
MISIGVIGSSGRTAIIEIIEKELLNNGKSVTVLEVEQNQSDSYSFCSGWSGSGSGSNNSSSDFMITSISSKCMLDNLISPIKFDILVQTAFEENGDELIEGLQKAVMCIKENGYFIFDSDFIQKISFPCESVYPVTYGLNGRTTITTSSIDDTEKLSFHYCLQRSIISLTESIIQPFEIQIKVDGKYNDVNYYLAAYTCLLILGYKF